MKRFSAIPIVLLLAAATFGYSVRIESFDVSPEGRDFSIRWQTEVEEEVREYELLRRTPYSNDQFVPVYSVRAHGVGKPYAFKDDQVYKSGAEQLDYRLEAVYENGLREVLVTKSLNYTSTAVRRTWGSIKAMFQ